MFKNIFKLLGLLSLVLLLSSCEKKISHDHQEMHWDRDMCVRCKMVISERNHAAQVVNLETGQGYKFDDIGCAILWFKEENISWKDSAKIWITDVKTSKWIDARTAFYDNDHITPMAYGFSANEKKESIDAGLEVINYEEMAKRVLKMSR